MFLPFFFKGRTTDASSYDVHQAGVYIQFPCPWTECQSIAWPNLIFTSRKNPCLAIIGRIPVTKCKCDMVFWLVIINSFCIAYLVLWKLNEIIGKGYSPAALTGTHLYSWLERSNLRTKYRSRLQRIRVCCPRRPCHGTPSSLHKQPPNSLVTF